MIKSALVATAAACGLAAMAFAGSASAQSANPQNLTVNAGVQPYCNVTLGNVTSYTASAAQEADQQIGTLNLACNSATGARFTVDVANGDLKNGSAYGINYNLSLRNGPLTFEDHDFSPADRTYSVTAPFSGDLSRGVAEGLWINLNKNCRPPADSAGNTNVYCGTNAPSGNYSETFTFTMTAA